MSRSHPRLLAISIALLALALAGSPDTQATTALGQIASEQATLDGLRVPSGTTLFSPSRVATGHRPALVHLKNGQVLALGQASRAVFASGATGGIEVEVEDGTLALRAPSGEIMTLARNSLLVLDDQGQIGEGTRVERMVTMCHLVDWQRPTALACLQDPSGPACKWDPIEVAESEVAQRLEMGDVVAGKDNNDVGLDENCKRDRAPVAAGLSPAGKAGIGLGSAAAALLIIDEIDDDDRREPATPVFPQ